MNMFRFLLYPYSSQNLAQLKQNNYKIIVLEEDMDILQLL